MPGKTSFYARVKVGATNFHLGTFATFEEAAQVEREFREQMGVQQYMTRPQYEARRQQMLEQRAAGMKWADIAAFHGITKNRAMQIVGDYERKRRARAKAE